MDTKLCSQRTINNLESLMSRIRKTTCHHYALPSSFK